MEGVRPIKINLLKREPQSSRSQFARMVTIILIIAVWGLMGGAYLITLKGLHAEQARHDSLKARYERYLKNEAVYRGQMDSLANVRQRERMIDTMEKGRVSYLDLLEAVEKAAPAGVVLDNLDMQMHSVVITGRAGNEDQVASMLAGLSVSPRFKNIKTVSISNEGKDEDGLFRFDIQYEWEAVQP